MLPCSHARVLFTTVTNVTPDPSTTLDSDAILRPVKKNVV